jgi:hypothetical protein
MLATMCWFTRLQLPLVDDEEVRDFAVGLIKIEVDIEVLQVEISGLGNQKYFFLSSCSVSEPRHYHLPG